MTINPERARSSDSPTHSDSIIRVLSVPAGHVYVQHLMTEQISAAMRRLPDPPVEGDVPAAQRWPPPALDPTWLRSHAEEFDVFHLNFGFDATSPQELEAVVRTLKELRKPFVYTVHDLRNPHHDDAEIHDQQLDVLVPAADALITLTQGAAEEILERWSRQAIVLPHPHVVPMEMISQPRTPHEDFTIGVHIKSLRANVDPLPVIGCIVDLLPALPDVKLRVDAHNDVMTPGFERYHAGAATYLNALADEGKIDLVVHDFFDDDELWKYLQSLDLSVLAYRFGTHSGWLEACFDLGTPVLVSDTGYYAEQRPCLTFTSSPAGPDVDSLSAAVHRAVAERPDWRADPDERLREREMVAVAHLHLYRELLQW